MDKAILYSERQRFKQWWLWLILLGVNGLFLFGVFKQVIGGQPFGDKPMSDAGLLIATGCDHQGDLWLGTLENGIFKFNGNGHYSLGIKFKS